MPNIKAINLHLLWIPEGEGHASIISSSLDMIEKELIKKGEEYSKIFNDLYLKTIEYILEKKVLSTIYPLMTDRMNRKECYYITKLSMVSDIKAPECDPTKPRIQI